MFEILDVKPEDASLAGSERPTEVLEAGGIIVLQGRPFELSPSERSLLDPAISDRRSKNISLDPATGTVGGTSLGEDRRAVCAGMIARFGDAADAVLAELTPRYSPALQRRRTSFRPGAIADRALSRRKDDRRLHVDAFPANPTNGRRILRVFANVNPNAEARIWNVGEEGFAATANRFRSRLTARGRTARIKAALGVTRGRQSAYDQMMLQLHDAAKLDDAYQAQAPYRRLAFSAGSLWVVYTDAVMHAAISGQHAFEQTYLMPVETMREPALSPLRILEDIVGRPLR